MRGEDEKLYRAWHPLLNSILFFLLCLHLERGP